MTTDRLLPVSTDRLLPVSTDRLLPVSTDRRLPVSTERQRGVDPWRLAGVDPWRLAGVDPWRLAGAISNQLVLYTPTTSNSPSYSSFIILHNIYYYSNHIHIQYMARGITCACAFLVRVHMSAMRTYVRGVTFRNADVTFRNVQCHV